MFADFTVELSRLSGSTNSKLVEESRMYLPRMRQWIAPLSIPNHDQAFAWHAERSALRVGGKLMQPSSSNLHRMCENSVSFRN